MRFQSRACFKVGVGILVSVLSSLALAKNDNPCLIAGPAHASVTIEEYADLECPYCQKGAELTAKAAAEFGAQVKVVFRTMPLRFHPHANVSALALHAVCAQSAQLGNEFQRSVFAHQADLIQDGEPFLYRTADAIGADVSKMKADMQTDRIAQEVAFDEARAKEQGVTGTPSFVIIGSHGRETVVGAVDYSAFKSAVQRQLEN